MQILYDTLTIDDVLFVAQSITRRPRSRIVVDVPFVPRGEIVRDIEQNILFCGPGVVEDIERQSARVPEPNPTGLPTLLGVELERWMSRNDHVTLWLGRHWSDASNLTVP